MKIVVDTTILLAALIRDSSTRKTLFQTPHKLFTPDFALSEIDAHLKEASDKNNLSIAENRHVFEILKKYINIVSFNDYRLFLPKAKQIMEPIDPNDVPFIACALYCRAAIWTNDNHYQQQKTIPVLKNEQMLKGEKI